MRNKALFLDRDGVINIDHGYTHKIEDFTFTDGIFDLCKKAQRLGYIIIVITNQAGIGRGYYTEEQFHILTNWMEGQFKNRGIAITKTYFCPYHPTAGIGKYKFDSPDRKPNPGMILKACQQHSIDPGKSILIGDNISDIQAASSANIPTRILLTTSSSTPQPDNLKYMACANLKSAEKFLPE